MNIIYGIWRHDGPQVTPEELESMAVHTRRFASDGEWSRIGQQIGMGVQAQYTHQRSRLEVQPTADNAGNLLVFDGRLDNYRDVIAQLNLENDETPDSEIILSAFRRWGSDCFSRLIGDWALALWDVQSSALYLARDHAGTRLLHYSSDISGKVVWATYLDSYIGTTLLDSLDPIYMSSYLAMLPCYERSPYRRIQSVLPGHFIKITQRGAKVSRFWTPAQHEQTSPRSIDDYKAEFLHLLEQSVARRTGPGAPTLGQLSGGMDSTSIICISDRLSERSGARLDLLDTLSYFNDSEPSWNERPYFTLVETKRGRKGYHLDFARYRSSFQRPAECGARYLYPGISENVLRFDIDLYALTRSRGHRSILSGIGGDEFTGGNPSPAADVADLFARGKVGSGMRCAFEWCVAQRVSVVELVGGTARFLREHSGSATNAPMAAVPGWLTSIARQNCETAISELPIIRLVPLFVRPRMAELSEAWWYTLRTQPHLKPSEIFRYEFRYPYLDRDFLEFLLRLPANMLARPGRRRFLMREALRGIVPDAVLERRRKAFLLASRLDDVRRLAPQITGIIDSSRLAESGYIDKTALRQSLGAITHGTDTRGWGALFRFAMLETWLQHREHSTAKDIPNRDSVGAHSSTDNVPAVCI